MKKYEISALQLLEFQSRLSQSLLRKKKEDLADRPTGDSPVPFKRKFIALGDLKLNLKTGLVIML